MQTASTPSHGKSITQSKPALRALGRIYKGSLLLCLLLVEHQGFAAVKGTASMNRYFNAPDFQANTVTDPKLTIVDAKVDGGEASFLANLETGVVKASVQSTDHMTGFSGANRWFTYGLAHGAMSGAFTVRQLPGLIATPIKLKWHIEGQTTPPTYIGGDTSIAQIDFIGRLTGPNNTSRVFSFSETCTGPVSCFTAGTGKDAIVRSDDGWTYRGELDLEFNKAYSFSAQLITKAGAGAAALAGNSAYFWIELGGAGVLAPSAENFLALAQDPLLAVPEPATWLMMVGGMVLFGLVRLPPLQRHRATHAETLRSLAG